METMRHDDLDAAEALAALERFVVDNDDLLALEERIGRFNIFDALGIVRTEIRHSNFLAWLLDPNESHGQGAMFLRALLMDLLKQAPPELRPFSPIRLDGAELHGVEVRREWRHIDILIRCDDPAFVIAIENKVDAGPHNPFEKYERAVTEEFPRHRPMYVYLTPEGAELEDYQQWTPYSYRDIHDTLHRIRNTNASSIGDDVRTFLDHYLNLIGSRFMDDPKIDELCQRIYNNHRQAIDMIRDRVLNQKLDVNPIADALESTGQWVIGFRSSSEFTCWPAKWNDAVIPHRVNDKGQSVPWVVMTIWRDQGRNALNFEAGIGPSVGMETLRTNIIRAVRDNAESIGLIPGGTKFTSGWVRVIRKQKLSPLMEQDGPVDIDALTEKTRKYLHIKYDALVKIADIVRPIIEQWQNKQAK